MAGGGSGPLHPEQGPFPWGAPACPKEEGQQQPPGLAPTLQEAALAAALSQNPTTSQTTAQADWEASGRWL